MPIYEYQCKACNKITDALQKMSDAPLLTCPECNENALKKLVSAPRFRLAGSGWYETDFKNDNQRNLVSQDTTSESKSDAKSDTSATDSSSEKKPDVKSESKKESAGKATETKPSSSEPKTESKSTTSAPKGDGKAA